MPDAAVVTIIVAAVIILVLAVFLLTIARVLVGVRKSLEGVIVAVGTIRAKTEPVNGVVESINTNLGGARDTLTSLLERKVGADGAAELVASVDPLAEQPADENTIRYTRAGEDVDSVGEGEPIGRDDEPMVLRRAGE